MLTHAARAAAEQPPLVAARGAREGLWLEQKSNEKFKAKILKHCLTLSDHPHSMRFKSREGARGVQFEQWSIGAWKR